VPSKATPPDPAKGAADRVYRGVMRDLEEGRMVPGQRLAESELAERFGVGRNAVREAIQRLATRGVLDLTRYRSAAIRKLDLTETLEILDVAAAMTALVARSAAERFEEATHAHLLDEAMKELGSDAAVRMSGAFSRARRIFYRSLLVIGANRELQRIFPAIGMHIIYSQYQSPELQHIRLADYRAISDAVSARDPDRAEDAGHRHVEHVRVVVQAWQSSI